MNYSRKEKKNYTTQHLSKEKLRKMSVSKVSLKENEKYNKKKNVFLEKKKKMERKKDTTKKKKILFL